MRSARKKAATKLGWGRSTTNCILRIRRQEGGRGSKADTRRKEVFNSRGSLNQLKVEKKNSCTVADCTGKGLCGRFLSLSTVFSRCCCCCCTCITLARGVLFLHCLATAEDGGGGGLSTTSTQPALDSEKSRPRRRRRASAAGRILRTFSCVSMREMRNGSL